MDVDAKELRNTLLLSVIANLAAAFIIYIVSLWLNRVLTLEISPNVILLVVLLGSALLSLITIARAYEGIVKRINYIQFLKEDSASRSFEMMIGIVGSLIAELQTKVEEPTAEDVEETVLPELNRLVSFRRQPMQVLSVDCTRILEQARKYPTPLSVLHQIEYYLDFMLAYKRMALPRIIKQANLYIDTFGRDEYTDYAVVYGHSTNVVGAIIAGYRINPFPIIVIEDLQYHAESLGEHKIVSAQLDEAGIPYSVISFEQIGQLFDPSITSITDTAGERISLLRRRRIHGMIGCERVDSDGNTLIPSSVRGIPSESAQFVQEIEAFSREQGSEGLTPARVVVIAESYKIREFSVKEDTATHVPLQTGYFRNLPYIVGIVKKMPQLHPVSLFHLDAEKIYVHINELGIFPNIQGQIDLSYCQSVFRAETSLLGLFVKPYYLKYFIFDEIQAVLFDFNGVIVNDEPIHYRAFKRILNDFDVDFGFEEYNHLCRGRSDTDGFERIKDEFDIDMDVSALVEKKHSAYLDAVTTSEVTAFPGVRRLLNELSRRGYKLALVTASNRQEVESVLYYLGLGDYFDVVISDDDVTESKPSPEGYLLASEQFLVSPKRCLVIDDSPPNIRAVTQVGMRTVGIRNETDLEFAGADHVFDSVEKLLVL